MYGHWPFIVRSPNCCVCTTDTDPRSFTDVTRVVADTDSSELYYGSGMIFFHGKVLRSGRWGCPRRHCPVLC